MKYFVLSLLLSCTLMVQSQQEEETAFPLEGPSDWRKEILSFPLDFAPSLEYDGTEYVLFSKGWADKAATDFWTYTFAWDLYNAPNLSEERLNKDLTAYFDGLMKEVAGAKISKDKITPTLVNLKSNNNGKSYEGQISIFDAFFLKEKITLNMRVITSYCATDERHIVYFQYSPQPFSHELWDEMKAIKIPCSN